MHELFKVTKITIVTSSIWIDHKLGGKIGKPAINEYIFLIFVK